MNVLVVVVVVDRVRVVLVVVLDVVRLVVVDVAVVGVQVHVYVVDDVEEVVVFVAVVVVLVVVLDQVTVVVVEVVVMMGGRVNHQSRNTSQASIKTTSQHRETQVHQWHLHANGAAGPAPYPTYLYCTSGRYG